MLRSVSIPVNVPFLESRISDQKGSERLTINASCVRLDVHTSDLPIVHLESIAFAPHSPKNSLGLETQIQSRSKFSRRIGKEANLNATIKHQTQVWILENLLHFYQKDRASCPKPSYCKIGGRSVIGQV